MGFYGSGVFVHGSFYFDSILFDEAAQASEPSTIIPLCRGAQQVYLIGDPLQLPATVISHSAEASGYCTSLFSRMMDAGYPVQKLTIQHRMHPTIIGFSSAAFYSSQLINGPIIEKRTRRSWLLETCLGPITFVNIRGHEKLTVNNTSFSNNLEAKCVASLFLHLSKHFPLLRNPNTTGIVSPYKAQVEQIHRFLFENRFNNHNTCQGLVLNTIDGFQGQEKDMVIFSAVKTGISKLGFVADRRRLNVGLTRARSCLIVVGNATALSNEPIWMSLINYCKKRGRFLTIM